MSSQLSFCPDCQSLLTTESDEKVYLKCPSCAYVKDLEGCHLLHSNRIKDSALSNHLPYTTIYDATIKRSTKVRCINGQCPSLDPTQWGQPLDNGIIVQPDVMLMNYNDPDRISTYICRVCGQVFRP